MSTNPLQHELRDDTVEDAALVVERLTRLSNALLTRAQRAEVLHSLWCCLAIQLHLNAPGRGAVDFNVEEDLVGDSRLACVSDKQRDADQPPWRAQQLQQQRGQRARRPC
jgi:hypothetical protein